MFGREDRASSRAFARLSARSFSRCCQGALFPIHDEGNKPFNLILAQRSTIFLAPGRHALWVARPSARDRTPIGNDTFDIIFDRSGRASFPPGFDTTMRRVRVALASGELGEYELVIVPTTGQLIIREQ